MSLSGRECWSWERQCTSEIIENCIVPLSFCNGSKTFYFKFLLKKIQFPGHNCRRLWPIWSEMGLRAVIFAECIQRLENHCFRRWQTCLCAQVSYPLKFITIRGILEILVFLQGQERCSKQISHPHTGCLALCIPDVLETCYLVTVEVWMRIPPHPKAHIFENLVSNWWHYLGRLRRCSGLAGGGVSLGAGFESSKTWATPSLPSCLHACGSGSELWAWCFCRTCLPHDVMAPRILELKAQQLS